MSVKGAGSVFTVLGLNTLWGCWTKSEAKYSVCVFQDAPAPCVCSCVEDGDPQRALPAPLDSAPSVCVERPVLLGALLQPRL